MRDQSIHKYNLGIIGNCSYLAYVDTSANVRWMCVPRFDTSFIFGSLLDNERGGEFSVMPDGGSFQSSQYYKENTNILCTEFSGSDYRFRVVDFAPRFHLYDRNFAPLMFMRIIEPLQGKPFINVKCHPVGDYGRLQPEIVFGSNHIRYLHIGAQVRLTTDIPLSYVIYPTPFVLNEKKYLVFTYGIPLEAPLSTTAEEFLEKTTKYWQRWVKSTSVPNFFQQEVIRSALVLKLHQFEDTGGIIASGTTSLPEYDQSGRNWDYRYCWLRDTFYTLNAFNNIGHFEELEKYFHYIQNIILNAKDGLQPLYTITGEKNIPEQTIDLNGYLGNRPVRIGNEAFTHIQNDIYGQVLATLLPLFTDARLKLQDAALSLPLIDTVLKNILRKIEEPDAGLWEFRNSKAFHCYTFLFHWIGAKAALKIGQSLGDTAMINLANDLIQRASEKIEACYDPERKVYTQAIGSPQLDASCLQLITMNYLDPGSEKARLHLAAIEKELKTPQGLVYRYKHADDFGFPKTTFLLCAFWHVEALACVGRVDEAGETFQNLMQFSNHLGLFSEDADVDGSQWGNFPQTYSHVGLINAAFRIGRKQDLPMFI